VTAATTSSDARQNQLSEEENRMTTTATAPAPTAPKITLDIQKRISACIAEMQADIKEREGVIHDSWVAAVGQLHLLMLGPGGTGKSLLVRRLTSHIENSVYFETAFDETTDPSQVFGPPDIKAMVEDGKTRRVITGMLPEATHAFLDEFFNANGPVLHSIQPPLNERIFHNNGVPMNIPLRSMFAGTNKLNADADQAALWDRIHIRHIVDYVSDRQNQIDLVGDAIARMQMNGRGTSTTIPGQQMTKVTLEELDQAHKEALGLDVPGDVIDTFFNLRDELKQGKAAVEISDRRTVEGMAAVLANAWVRGHESVTVADLDILSNMWWTLQDQRAEVRQVILAATNPGEKAALDLLDELDTIRKEIRDASGEDDTRKKKVAIEQVKNCDRLLAEANVHLTKTSAAGASTTRINEVIAKTEALKQEVARDFFGISVQTQQNLNNAASV
jgi:MoxR-like ATPase